MTVADDPRYNVWVTDAAAIGIQLEAKDFHQEPNGDYTIDGMDPGEWVEAMSMD